ncbi:invasion associated locus B family protein [Brucella anthropi]|uniref:invasion associated locus B family protein n=1 Tax=Brucella anthropi TaxID=529 RepID=UPI000698A966|nr:invasion associated locus B family protein [Brucella anthropi]
MNIKSRIVTSVMGLCVFACSIQFAAASDAFSGGATSVREQHGDWSLICAVVEKNERKTKDCVIQQEQVKKAENGPSQRVLAIEFHRQNKELNGVLVLPLGLRLEDGVVLQVDDAKPMAKKNFSTCLYSGCLVDLTAEQKVDASLVKGKTLSVKAVTNDEKPIEFSVSLNGFQTALDRASELLK